MPSTYGDLRPARSWSGDVAGLGDRSNAALVNAYHFDEPEKRRAAVSNISRVALDVDDFRLLVAALDLGDVVEELRAERHPPAEPVPADPVAFGRELLESHWLTRSSGGRQSHRWDALHYAALSDAQLAELGETSRVDGPLVLACGRRVNEAEVPSLSDRSDKPRCERCCDKRGLPRGAGAPKNDQICRDLLGFDAEQQGAV